MDKLIRKQEKCATTILEVIKIITDKTEKLSEIETVEN